MAYDRLRGRRQQKSISSFPQASSIWAYAVTCAPRVLRDFAPGPDSARRAPKGLLVLTVAGTRSQVTVEQIKAAAVRDGDPCPCQG